METEQLFLKNNFTDCKQNKKEWPVTVHVAFCTECSDNSLEKYIFFKLVSFSRRGVIKGSERKTRDKAYCIFIAKQANRRNKKKRSKSKNIDKL